MSKESIDENVVALIVGMVGRKLPRGWKDLMDDIEAETVYKVGVDRVPGLNLAACYHVKMGFQNGTHRLQIPRERSLDLQAPASVTQEALRQR